LAELKSAGNLQSSSYAKRIEGKLGLGNKKTPLLGQSWPNKQVICSFTGQQYKGTSQHRTSSSSSPLEQEALRLLCRFHLDWIDGAEAGAGGSR